MTHTRKVYDRHEEAHPRRWYQGRGPDRAPPNFDPFTADEHTLREHGFPPVPADVHHQARYQRVYGRIKNKFDFVVPTFRVNADRFHGPAQNKEEQAGTETSTNWSGGVVYAPAGDSFKWVEGDWVIPDVDAPTLNQWYYSASWIGLDGDGSGDVFQAGIECEAYRSSSGITTNIYPWWEWYPQPEVQITNFPVKPGDMITCLLCSPSAAGSTTGTVYFTNRTTGASTSLNFSAPAGTSLVGNSAEWVVEAPTVGGAQSPTADYGQVFFNVCNAVTKGNKTIGGGTGNNINQTEGGNEVSAGTLVSSTVVECEYVGQLP